ncbi:hypothetical protein [Zobellella maritima]|uniref:hypothetical protein n=1 Tax=Zobellella maritima TaxID=2059725 RepID=UPI0013003EC5|nr:hypothetical protein [Zobellella maritima]
MKLLALLLTIAPLLGCSQKEHFEEWQADRDAWEGGFNVESENIKMIPALTLRSEEEVKTGVPSSTELESDKDVTADW